MSESRVNGMGPVIRAWGIAGSTIAVVIGASLLGIWAMSVNVGKLQESNEFQQEQIRDLTQKIWQLRDDALRRECVR